jgi:hypothetical protein
MGAATSDGSQHGLAAGSLTCRRHRGTSRLPLLLFWIGAVLVGPPAGASIAGSQRGVNEEPGCHQGYAENLDGATHVSSLQVGVADDAHR